MHTYSSVGEASPPAGHPQRADAMAALLASFTSAGANGAGATVSHGMKRVLIDATAVALGALEHDAARAARRYGAMFPVVAGARLWGTSTFATPEVAALVNGAPLRAYDYNDLYIGSVDGGHPSDLISAVIAAGEWTNASGRQLIASLAVGYDVTLALFETIDLSSGGWDYVNSTMIGAVCAVAHVLHLTETQTYEALTIVAASHLATSELESSELNARGDLTMWKRFNNGDAMRNAVYACFLALAGVEGPVRAFTGNNGFLAHTGNADAVQGLRERLGDARGADRALTSTLKRWPVGSRAQSAIDAAIRARAAAGDGAAIAGVRVLTNADSYEHLVSARTNPWAPDTRETADHSLPYIVAAAVLDGYVKPESFAPAVVKDPARQRFLREAVTVEVSGALQPGAAAGYLTRIEIRLHDGRTITAGERPAPGHPLCPFTDADLSTKLTENAEALFTRDRIDAILATLWSLETLPNIRSLTALFAAGL